MDEPQPILRGADALAATLRAVAAAPRATALFCDIDGTVSPIVSDPYQAVVPEPFRAALAALAPRLGLLAFVTGRDVRQAAAMVGLQGVAYVGLHGFDRMAPDGAVSRDPAAEPYVEAVQRMARRVRGLDAARLGLVVENKGPMLDLHYRKAADPDATLAELEAEVLRPARDLGLAVATGHFLVELRPPVAIDKGTAVLSLLRSGPGPGAGPGVGGDDGAGGGNESAGGGDESGGPYQTAIFLGDDLTDCTGFAAVHEWARAGGGTALAVAALTPETPRKVKDDADVWVAATPGVFEVLTALLEATQT